MNEVTRILWSGVTGRTGMEAVRIARDREDVTVTGGFSLRGRSEHRDVEGKLRHLSVWAGYGDCDKVGFWVETTELWFAEGGVYFSLFGGRGDWG